MNEVDPFCLTGRVAFVIGGGGAIGSAIAVALGRAGAAVALAGRNSESLVTSADKVISYGSDALAIPADMSNEQDAERAVEAVVSRYGCLDILVNAAGGGAGQALYPAESYPTSAWKWVMELNLWTTVVATQAAARAMIGQGRGGHVLNVSSVRGQLGINAGYAAYVGAKGALNALTRQWATEWARFGITVNAIAPTFVDTPQVAMLLGDPSFKERLLTRIPMKRVAETADLVGAALLFCSDAGAFITGQVLSIDGGLTATQ